MATPTKKILIYRLGSLGDTVMVLPVFHQIRIFYPSADITLLTNQPVAAQAAPLESILGSGFFFDRVLAYPVGTRSVAVLFTLLKQIRHLNIDTVIYLAGVRVYTTIFKTKLVVLRDWWFFKAGGVKTMIGFPETQQDLILAVDAATGELEWEAKRIARRVIKGLGKIALNEDRYWDLRFTQIELETAATKLCGVAAGQKIIAASTGTKSQVNNWEESNWISLFYQLKLSLPGWYLVIIGGPDELSTADKCLKAWGGEGVNLCGQTTPRVSGAILKQAKGFIGHDSGPMHLAAAVGTPCTAIFSARHLPRQWYPRGNFNKIIYHKTDCAGCGLDVCIQQKKKCILSVTTTEVINALMENLGLNMVKLQ